VAIDRVGLYIPGGRAPLFSTVLMLACPARIAGCKEIILCTPQSGNRPIAPEILYAAAVCGIDRIYRIGGAQAIAAMALGTESIPKVDKIFGPGNRYVTKAKQQLSATVAIDMPAGPSAVLVMADDSANPTFIAADLLSQAEHGPDSQAILVCTSERIASETQAEISRLSKKLSREDSVAGSLSHSRLIVMYGRDDMIDFVNAYAPEHLIITLDSGPGDTRGRQCVHRQLLSGKRRRLCVRHKPHTSHLCLGAGLQRREPRQFHAQDHLPGTHARRPRTARACYHRNGRSRRA